MTILLDTNICIEILNRTNSSLIQMMATRSPSQFSLCSIVKAELLYGARNSSKVEANLSLLRRFFQPFTSFAFDDQAAQHYGYVRSHLKACGQLIGANDMFIASIALAKDLTILTRNSREFERIPGLRVIEELEPE